jgi:hypothetical protein
MVATGGSAAPTPSPSPIRTRLLIGSTRPRLVSGPGLGFVVSERAMHYHLQNLGSSNPLIDLAPRILLVGRILGRKEVAG